MRKLLQLASKVHHNRSAKVLKAWHGTSVEMGEKIMQLGFANLGKTDNGWYGKGTK